MSRYLDFSTTGEQSAVAERRRHTLQRIGKVQDFDVSGRLTGTVPIEGWVARVVITWKPGRKHGSIKVELEANSDDKVNRAADAAMYKFISAYKGNLKSNWLARLILIGILVLIGSVILALKSASVF
jgi:hypothetical protein